ncbi:DUF551 domain-containing protein [Klebsiella pneumoniae]|nr:DUF551 domain-containing protein [Klebsiella pneumoniae]
MTSKLTRERLEQLADNNTICKVSWDERIELAQIALAAMDSEPVAYIDKQWTLVYYVPPMSMGLKIGDKLYRHAQPAPVSYSDFEEFWSAYIHPLAQDDELKGFAWDIWCAAMLQAGNSPAQSDCCPAQNSATPAQDGNSPAQSQKWIPVSERIPDNTEPVLCIEKRADFGTYGQPFVCWHDGGGWVGKTNYRPIVTHWMPLPADPQEVK